MKKPNKKRGMALSQIILLVASVVAFSYVLGGNFPVVSADSHERDYIMASKILWQIQVDSDNYLITTCLESRNPDFACEGGLKSIGIFEIGFCLEYGEEKCITLFSGDSKIKGDEKKTLTDARKELEAFPPITTSSTSSGYQQSSSGKGGDLNQCLQYSDGSIWKMILPITNNPTKDTIQCVGGNCVFENTLYINEFCGFRQNYCSISPTGTINSLGGKVVNCPTQTSPPTATTGTSTVTINSVRWESTDDPKMWKCISDNCGKDTDGSSLKGANRNLCFFYGEKKIKDSGGSCDIYGSTKGTFTPGRVQRPADADKTSVTQTFVDAQKDKGEVKTVINAAALGAAIFKCKRDIKCITGAVSDAGVVPGNDVDAVAKLLRNKTFKDETEAIQGVKDAIAGVPALKKANLAASSAKGIQGIIGAAAWAGGISLLTKFVVGSFAPEASSAASSAAFAGVFVGKYLYGVFSTRAAATLAADEAAKLSFLQANPLLGATLIAAPIAYFVFAFSYKKTSLKVVSYSCFVWDAPVGGKDCGECNEGDLPCSEYRCRSLGQACDLVNKGTTEELCVFVSPKDVNPPEIRPWEETLTIDYRYSPDNTISPPDRGVKIVESATNGCVVPFTPLRFGITLDEPAKCKIDNSRKGSFDEMDFFFGGSSTSKLNHSQTMSLPSPAALAAENITLENGGEFSLYARCQDANGNSNEANFVFRFCVDEGPDTTPPLIVTTSILNNMPISFDQTSTDLIVYVNEPAECKWSKLDQSYDSMENDMVCDANVLEMNAQLLYQCSTTLTGLNDLVDNDFYFRCKDQPLADDENDRNVNTESFKFTLVGTRPLVIDSVEPNNTVIKDSTNIIKVTLEARTSAGFNEGEAICYYSETGVEGTHIEFFNSGSHQHSQDLFLAEGSYNYFIRCVDLGGNADNQIINFDVESDSDSPLVVRIFHEENDLKIITNENATCVYSNLDCSYSFEDGEKGDTKMSSLDDVTHFTDWDPKKNFYIKCEDNFGNRPLPNSCSIIARPFQI